MNRCLDTPDFITFLSLINVTITPTVEGIIVHATDGDVLWRWLDTLWCWG